MEHPHWIGRVVGNDVWFGPDPQGDHRRYRSSVAKSIPDQQRNVVYEILGKQGEFIALTPGGRFSKDIPGLRPLAQELVKAATGCCCGTARTAASPMCSSTARANHMRAETLAALISNSASARASWPAAPGGARDSMLTTMLYPGWSKLVVWNIVGGRIVRPRRALHRAGASWRCAAQRGIKPLPPCRNGGNGSPSPDNPRPHLLSQDRTVPQADAALAQRVRAQTRSDHPGSPGRMFDNITVPTLIIRRRERPRPPQAHLLEVSCLIKVPADRPAVAGTPGNARRRGARHRKVKRFCLFDTWVLAAPRS